MDEVFVGWTGRGECAYHALGSQCAFHEIADRHGSSESGLERKSETSFFSRVEIIRWTHKSSNFSLFLFGTLLVEWNRIECGLNDNEEKAPCEKETMKSFTFRSPRIFVDVLRIDLKCK